MKKLTVSLVVIFPLFGAEDPDLMQLPTFRPYLVAFDSLPSRNSGHNQLLMGGYPKDELFARLETPHPTAKPQTTKENVVGISVVSLKQLLRHLYDGSGMGDIQKI